MSRFGGTLNLEISKFGISQNAGPLEFRLHEARYQAGGVFQKVCFDGLR